MLDNSRRPDRDVDLTVCVIGRNEARNLPRLAGSLAEFDDASLSIEKIYVDSDSQDASVDMARGFCDVVCVLQPSPDLSAAAGRFIGTQHAAGKWILYLDGDMALCPEFVSVLRDFIGMNDGASGLTGRYVNIYETGGSRTLGFGSRHAPDRASHFGGAVILRRDVVLRAGNWNPRLYAYEEAELLTRIRALGYRIAYEDVPFVRHFTERTAGWDIALFSFLPLSSGIGKKYFGFGQVLAARFRQGNLLDFVRFYPEPFVYWSCLAVALALAALGAWLAASLAAAAGVGYVWAMKGLRFAFLYLAFLPQGVVGWWKYDDAYMPSVVDQTTNSGDADHGAG